MPQFLELLHATVRYFFIKGVVHNSVNAVRDTIYRVCADIEMNRDYLANYSGNIEKGDKSGFAAAIETDRLRRYQRGLVLLCAHLNPRQNRLDFAQFLDGKYDIEHILPRQWNHYDGWTDTSWEEQLNLLGNLMPLGKALNIKAKNEFFARKKIEYKKSKVQDALDLLALQEWTPSALEAKQEEKVQRLLDYFQITP